MEKFDPEILKKLYIPSSSSHKGQNGKLMVVGGSKLFHAASLWSLTVASKILDMVYYSSVPENNEIVQKAKEEFRNGIVVKREHLDSYLKEADCILIGPGLPRPVGEEKGDDDTRKLTEQLLKNYPDKRWVIDGGSLQVIDPSILPKNSIVTPHKHEFKTLFGIEPTEKTIPEMAKKYQVVILAKGEKDIVCSSSKYIEIEGGNAGMTKGGTGDVLAGLTASLYCNNDDPVLVASAASFINKKAGDSLFEKVGYYFNASDLANEIPFVLKKYLITP